MKRLEEEMRRREEEAQKYLTFKFNDDDLKKSDKY